jgi:AMMECR1 domain-containing protein
MARALAEVLDPGTAIVVSSDFTHHGARYGYAPFAGRADLADTLLAVGRATAGRLAAADPDGFWHQLEVSGDTVCGRRPLAVLAELLDHAFKGAGSIAGLTTSGHVSGSFDFSVTYAAVVFAGAWQSWTEDAAPPTLGALSGEEKTALLELARATLRSHLTDDARSWSPTSRRPGVAGRPGLRDRHNTDGATTEGLRVCMGIIEAREPSRGGVGSIVRRPRSAVPVVTRGARHGGFGSRCYPRQPVAGPEAIEVGRHGVVLSKSGRRAVFLPQVATEQGWTRDEMLTQLSRKAGLPADAWRQGATFEVFTAQVFAEGS